MKKILTASLVAMMAVTAANADIASTQYVNKKLTGDAENGTLSFSGAAADQTTLQGAVNAIADSLSTSLGAGGNVETQIANKVGELGEYTTVAAAIAGAQAAAEATAADDATAKANTALADAKSYADTAKAAAIQTAGANADTKINTLKGEMKLAKVGGANKYIASVTQADGKVTAEVGTIDTAVIANSANLVTSGAVATAIAGANGNITALQETVAENTLAITGINGEITEIIGDINAINNAETGALATMKTELEGKITTAQSTLEGKITAAQSAAEQTAAEDATSKANAALAEAKSYADDAEADAVSTAAADATTKANKALADAKAEAKSKADQALADAKADAQLKIEALDKADTAVAGEYVSAVSEVDGVISVSRAALTPVAKMDVPADCATKLCALVYDKVNSSAGNPVLKWEVIAE